MLLLLMTTLQSPDSFLTSLTLTCPDSAPSDFPPLSSSSQSGLQTSALHFAVLNLLACISILEGSILNSKMNLLRIYHH